MKRIMILGGGIMQVPSIKTAKKNGWQVIVADGNPRAPGKELADFFEHVDLRDREKMAETALRYKKNLSLDGVFTAGTDFSTTVAWVAEKLGLPGIPYSVALRATDKDQMRRCFAENQVPSPEYSVITSLAECEALCRHAPFPLVVKPVDNMGARGIRKVEDPEELLRAAENALTYSRAGRVIIEEYIEGPEYSLDAIVWEGTVTVCGIADRHIFFPPYFVEMGHTMPAMTDEIKDIESVVRVFKQGIRAIGIDKGAAKGDIKLSSRGAKVGEIAARLSGGYMSGWTFPYHSGVDVTDAALHIAVGIKPENLAPRWSKVSAERAFISIPGEIISINGREKALEIPGVQDVFQAAEQGERIDFPTNNVQKCGNIIAVSENRLQAAENAEKGCAAMIVELKPGDTATCNFLLKETHQWAPSAYSLNSVRNRDAIEAMEIFSGNPGIPAVPFIAELPEMDAETGEDWNHIPFSQGLKRINLITGAEAAEIGDTDSFVLGKVFWKVFLRGGYQAGIWLIKTIEIFESDRDAVTAFLKRWQ